MRRGRSYGSEREAINDVAFAATVTTWGRSELVSAPIRYGRRSGKRRGNTYTMVFSHGAAAGQAKVVWCSHTIASAENLIAEAVKLWEVEARERDTVRIAAGLGGLRDEFRRTSGCAVARRTCC